MQLCDKVIIVTGGGHGIGRALCQRFAQERPRGMIVADLDAEAAESVAREVAGHAIPGDVRNETHIQHLVAEADARWGGVDLFCSNAGATIKGGVETPDADWQRMWELHVLSHVYAARAALPGMLSRGEGYFLQTSSAAGLLTEIGSAAYSVTKHATVSFAEWLSVNYRRAGIRVSCLCPSGVQTDMLNLSDPIHQFLQAHALSADDVAECVVRGIAAENFLILPHPEVGEFFAAKPQDYDRWLHQFSRMKEKWDRPHKPRRAA
ncbi:MAG: SDR family oxidoreductase [Planctomycetes bacterium]|nr:SDR family oxidoreductase [Planctomycetota bacterium]